MSIMLIMSCYTGFFNVRRGWQSLNTGSRFYLRLIRRTGWLWFYTSRTTDGRPFKTKKLSVPFQYPGVIYIMLFFALMKMHIIQLALLSLWPFILLYLHTFSAYSFYIWLIHYVQIKSLSDMENTFVCRFDYYWGQMYIIQLALFSLWLFILLYLHKLINN